MEHSYIEERQIVDRYVMGNLPPEEAEVFEDHYLSCQQCLDQLALAESMQRGFKRAAGQDAARLTAARQLALVAWLSRLSRSRQAAALLLMLLAVAVIALPGALAWRRLGNADRELAETRRALKQEREKAAAGSRSASEAERLRAELEANRQDLARERQARMQAAEQLAQAQVPQANTPMLFLDAVRGSRTSGEAPDQKLHRPPGNGWVLLGLALPSTMTPPFRVVLRDSHGREVWRGAGLSDDQGELRLILPGSLLAPRDDYTFTVEGSGSPAAPAARFTFRVLS